MYESDAMTDNTRRFTPAVPLARRPSERGNALFLLLIAIALFGALSYAVTHAGRSGGFDQEKGLLSAAQVTQYPAGLSTTVKRMLKAGVTDGTLTFDPAATGPGAVFSSQGGGAQVEMPPKDVGDATAWRFKTTPADGAGRSGWFVAGVGDDGAAGKDVFAFLDNVSPEVCQHLLRGLGLDATPLAEKNAVDFTGTNEGRPDQTGGASGATSLAQAKQGFAFNAWNDAGNPQTYACVRNGPAGEYVYYHVLAQH